MIGVQNPWGAKNGRNESSEPRVAPMSGGELAWIAGCIAFASFAQTLSGFGFSLLAVPLMTLVVSPRDAVVVATIIGAISTTSQAVIDRKHVDSSIAKRLILASYAGMPFGLMAFIFVSETGLRLVLGVVVISAAMLLLRGFRLREDSHHLDWLFGIVSGFLSTSTSTNGPPLVFLMQARQLAPATFRATINTVFAVVNVGALALFVSAGKVNGNNLSGVAVAVPALGVALAIGYAVRRHITQERFNTLVILLLFLSAISVVVSAFTN
jgi:uncharacterized membrane protein YfcA